MILVTAFMPADLHFLNYFYLSHSFTMWTKTTYHLPAVQCMYVQILTRGTLATIKTL